LTLVLETNERGPENYSHRHTHTNLAVTQVYPAGSFVEAVLRPEFIDSLLSLFLRRIFLFGARVEGEGARRNLRQQAVLREEAFSSTFCS